MADSPSLMLRIKADASQLVREVGDAARALNALGLEGKEIGAMGTDQAMKSIARAMSGYADSADKTAVALALFGRSGADLIPFLNQLGVAGEIGAKVTAEQAEQAKNLQDNFTKLSASGEAWKKELANGLIPALSDASSALLATLNGVGGLRDGVRGLAADGSLDRWAKDAVGGLIGLANAADGALTVFKLLANGAGQALESIVTSAKISGIGIGAGLTDEGQAKIKELWGQHEASVKKAEAETQRLLDKPLLGDAVQASLNAVAQAKAEALGNYQAAMNAVPAQSDAMGQKAVAAAVKAIQQAYGKYTAPDLGKFSADAAEKVDKEASAYRQLAARIAEKTAVLAASQASAHALTEGQKEALKLTVDLEAGTLKLTRAHESQARAQLAALIAAEQTAQAQKDEEAWQKSLAEESSAVHDAWMDDQRAERDALGSAVAAQKEHNATVGLSREQLDRRAGAQLADTLALKERELALVSGQGAEESKIDMLRSQIGALKDLRALKSQGAALDIAQDAAKKAQEDWKHASDEIERALTDSLMRAFESGKGFGQTFKETMVNLFKTMVLRPIIQGVVQGGLSAVGLGGSSGVYSAAGSLGNLAQTGSSLYSAYTAISTGAGALPGTTALANATGALGGDSLGALITLNPQWASTVAASTAATVEGTAATEALAAPSFLESRFKKSAATPPGELSTGLGAPAAVEV